MVWVIVGMVPSYLYGVGDSNAAQLGDSFGIASSLFSGLALAGVLIAIILQSQELRLQREELELTRKELMRTANAQEQSQEALELQARLGFLSSYMQALTSVAETSIDNPEAESLERAQIRTRSHRIRHELDSFLSALEPELVKLHLPTVSMPPVLLQQLEELLRLAEMMNTVGKFEVRAFEELATHDVKIAMLEQNNHSAKIESQWGRVLDIIDPSLSEYTDLQRIRQGFVRWQSTLGRLGNGEFDANIKNTWNILSVESEQLTELVLSLSYRIPSSSLMNSAIKKGKETA